LLLTGIQPPALGSAVTIAITLPDRYIEFEVSAVVAWHKGPAFGAQLEHLTARQAYGITLAMDIAARAIEATPARARATRG